MERAWGTDAAWRLWYLTSARRTRVSASKSRACWRRFRRLRRRQRGQSLCGRIQVFAGSHPRDCPGRNRDWPRFAWSRSARQVVATDPGAPSARQRADVMHGSECVNRDQPQSRNAGADASANVAQDSHFSRRHVLFGSTALKWLRSEEHTSELQSLRHLVCRLLLEKKKT